MLGMSAREWSRYLHDELGVPLEPSEINDRVVARLLAGYERHLPLLPGAAAAVRRLAAVWTLGLASAANRPVIDAVLTAAGLVECFTVTVSTDEVEHGKPAPDVYLLAVDRLGRRAGASGGRRGLNERVALRRRGGFGRHRGSQPRLPAHNRRARARLTRRALARRADARANPRRTVLISAPGRDAPRVRACAYRDRRPRLGGSDRA